MSVGHKDNVKQMPPANLRNYSIKLLSTALYPASQWPLVGGSANSCMIDSHRDKQVVVIRNASVAELYAL